MGYKIVSQIDSETHPAIEYLSWKLSDTKEDCEYTDNVATERIYPFSNENLDKIFEGRKLDKKRVATIGNSLDQALYAILHGCKDVTVIDGCPYTQVFGELKLAAMKNLEYEDFVSYFTYDGIFNHKYYAKISHDLTPYAKVFGDEIMLSGRFINESEPEINNLTSDYIHNIWLHGQLFQQAGNSFHCGSGLEYFKNKNIYNKIKEKLNNVTINFIVSDFSEFPEKLEGKYHLILLSNVKDYVPKEEFFGVVKKLHKEKLKVGGSMQIYYDFLPSCDNNYENYKDFVETFKGKKIRVMPVQDIRWHNFYCSNDLIPRDCNVLFL